MLPLRRTDIDEIEGARENLVTRTKGRPKFPLSSAFKQIYDGFPEYLLTWEMKDKHRTMDEPRIIPSCMGVGFIRR